MGLTPDDTHHSGFLTQRRGEGVATEPLPEPGRVSEARGSLDPHAPGPDQREAWKRPPAPGGTRPAP